MLYVLRIALKFYHKVTNSKIKNLFAISASKYLFTLPESILKLP